MQIPKTPIFWAVRWVLTHLQRIQSAYFKCCWQGQQMQRILLQYFGLIVLCISTTVCVFVFFYLGVMAMNGYSTFPKVAELEHHMQFCVISKALVGEGCLTAPQRCSRRILQPQTTEKMHLRVLYFKGFNPYRKQYKSDEKLIPISEIDKWIDR